MAAAATRRPCDGVLVRQVLSTDTAIQITDDGSRTVHSERYAQTYHSTFGAVTEARHVFLDATGIAARLRRQQDTRVLEIGFGLGLNALLTADLALSLASTGKCHLSYHAFEHDLIDVKCYQSLQYDTVLDHPELSTSVASLLQQAHAGDNNEQFAAPCTATLAEGVNLTLHLQDATATDGDFFTANKHAFHAIYLDAFCPQSNAECWTPDFITRLAGLLSHDGFLSTYSAKGDVRRAMLDAGLQVQKLPGPPGKREMLLARQ